MISAAYPCARPFQFDRDTFTFVNELVWEYRMDPATGLMRTYHRDSVPAYTHRCFVMVRAARQFFYHARFDVRLPAAGPAACRSLVREVMASDPRVASPETERIVIPGYDCLRAFSLAQEPLLKAECGSAWESYFVRSHWRMVMPVARRHQQRMAEQLARAVAMNRAPVVHLFRFPRVTINHGIVLFDLAESDSELRFDAYDPNTAAHPVRLIYDRATRTFSFPQTIYWAGGPLNVYEMYIGGLY